MKVHSLLSAVAASALVVTSGVAITQGASLAAAGYQPHGSVQAIRVPVGSGKVCQQITVKDQDTPEEKLVVSIADNPAGERLTLEGQNGRQLCLDTSVPQNLAIVRLRVTDGENTDLFETTINVYPKPNAAPKGSIPAIDVQVGTGSGKFCQPAELTDENHKVEELTLALADKVEGISVEGHSVCVDTTKPLGKKTIALGVMDPEGDATPFNGSVRVFAVPTIEFADISAAQGDGEGTQVCVPVTVSDADDDLNTVVVSKVSGPDAVSVQGKNLCVSTAKALVKSPVELKVEDADKHFATLTKYVVVTAKPQSGDKAQSGDKGQSDKAQSGDKGQSDKAQSGDKGQSDKAQPGDKAQSDKSQSGDKGQSVPSSASAQNKAKTPSTQSLAKTGFVGGLALVGALVAGAIGAGAYTTTRRPRNS